MLDDPPRDDRTDRDGSATGTPGQEPRPPAPPPRPPMSLETAPPLKPSLPPPPAMRTARGLWLAALAAGTATVLFTVTLAAGRLAALDQVVRGLAPDVSADRVAAVARLLYWSSLAGFAVGLLLQAVLVLLALRGRAAARWWALAVALVPQSAAAIGVVAFVAIDDGGTIIWLLAAVHWVLGLAAVICSFLPGNREWLTAQREATARPRS